MQFNAEQYYRAALDRMRQARRLYESGDSYAPAMYFAGLAVESLLRAFRWKKDSSFEGRHDLFVLVEASGLFKIDDEHMRSLGVSEEEIGRAGREVRKAMQEVAGLWHNNLRFASEAALKLHLVKIRRVQGIKGDPLKKNTQDIIEAAQTIMDRGAILWNSQKKS